MCNVIKYKNVCRYLLSNIPFFSSYLANIYVNRELCQQCNSIPRYNIYIRPTSSTTKQRQAWRVLNNHVENNHWILFRNGELRTHFV